MPVAIAPLGVELTIVKLLLDEKTKKHFENLGVMLNSTITIISNSGGNLIIQIKSTRLAIDRNLAMKIFVA